MATGFFCVAATTATGESNFSEAVTDEVIARLAGYEWQMPEEPLSIQNAPAILIQVAGDERHARYIRTRAIATLSLYATDPVWAFLAARVERAVGVDRRRAVDVLCDGFVASRSSQVTSLLVPLLAAEDPHLRARSAVCLGHIGSEEANAALVAYRRAIENDWEATAAGFTAGDALK